MIDSGPDKVEHGNALQIFHVNFNCSDLDRSRAFYESIGFKIITDFSKTGRDGKRKFFAEIGLAPVAGGARRGPLRARGLRVRKDGSEFWANLVRTSMHDLFGTHVGFIKITRDLTARKRAEEQGAVLAAALDHNPDAIILIDRGGRIVTVNNRTAELFGYPKEALPDLTVEMLLPERYRDAGRHDRRATRRGRAADTSRTPYPLHLGLHRGFADQRHGQGRCPRTSVEQAVS
jgi:PAS domain-containing protein